MLPCFVCVLVSLVRPRDHAHDILDVRYHYDPLATIQYDPVRERTDPTCRVLRVSLKVIGGLTHAVLQ
jgi:hypothetical protein